ncbi:MAG: hypothetical protein COB15_03495 [Flavobacteriales bacterium]|nr:MAG: hypothetical protein COB15_03495 [Flavobacteriales bacterium]
MFYIIKSHNLGMNKLLQKITVVILFLGWVTLSAQNVGINAAGTAPSGDAMLDISSADKGLLIPRVSITNLTLIGPITGGATTSLLVYNTNGATGLGYHYWDGNDWIKFLSGANVDNALYFNTGACKIRLGGPLVENTTVTQDGFGMTWNLNGTGDFNIQDNGTTTFRVLDDGTTDFGDDVDWRDGSVTGTLLMNFIDDGNDGRLRIYENGVTSVDLDANTQFVFNEQGFDRNFRVESNNQTNMFFVDAGADRVGIGTATPTYELDVVGNIGHNQYMYHNGDGDTYWRFTNLDQIQIRAGNVRMIDFIEGGSDYIVINENSVDMDFRIESNGQAYQFFVNGGNDRIGIRNATPTWMFHMTNGGINVGAAPMAAFDNNTAASGVAISASNNGASNGYNAVEGINSYSGTAFIPSGVLGLAIWSGTANAPTIGIRGATNEWQGTGVYGSRFNSGGANTGWGGEFYNDLGYTGFFGPISDRKTKKDIKKIDNALVIIGKLNPVTYNFDLDKYPNMGLNTEMEYGFIAQEVKAILPEITREKTFNTNSCIKQKATTPLENKRELFTVLDYTRIIPILTKAVQEQQTIIESQNLRIENLEKLVENLLNK